MPTISVVNLKGGSGKTTTCKELGALLFDLGLLAKLIDANPENGDLSVWAEEAGIPCRSLYPADLGLLEQAARSPQYYLMDCPPWEGPETRAALAYSAGIVVPVGPSLQDLRGLGRTMDLIRVAKAEANPELRVALVGTNYRPNTGLWRPWAEAIRAAASPEEGIEVAGLVQSRQLVVDTFGKGTAACRAENAAGAEVREVLAQVARILGLPIPQPSVEEVL